MPDKDYAALAKQLSALLALTSPPLAISFLSAAPPDVAPYGGKMPAPTPDGRTGAVSAGCVFWIKAAERTFATAPADHGNCSVGSLTHGLLDLPAAASRADVQALVKSGWVSEAMFPEIPTVRKRPGAIVYGPLHEASAEPDVVFLRLNARQVMVLRDALPELRFEGKPQCHIIPIAKELGQPAVSVGCMLSRVRTGMSNTEMTCAIPGPMLGEVVARLHETCGIDGAVAAYAAEDATRFR